MKRIVGCFTVLAISVGLLSNAAFADDVTAIEAYMSAAQKVTDYGTWTEILNMSADARMSKGSISASTFLSFETSSTIENYTEEDTSQARVNASGQFNILNQNYSFNVQYENGTAHIEYTEPNKFSTDIELENDYFFDLSIMNENLMKDAEINGNIVTYTVLGDDVAESGIVATEMIPGVSNINYDDIYVKATIDELTGILDTVYMEYSASYTYQGYDFDCDYIVNYQFITNSETSSSNVSQELEELEDGLVIFSDRMDLSIPINEVITLSAGVIREQEYVEDISDTVVFWVDDPSILEVEDTGVTNNYRYVSLRGIKDGVTTVGFSESDTGQTVEVPITVYTSDNLSYTISSVPESYIYEDYSTNFYNVSGLFIDDYEYVINSDGTADISFDVYNRLATYGVVEIYNANGEIQDAVIIDKVTLSNYSIKSAVWDNIGYLVRDLLDGEFGSYRSETSGFKHTPITLSDVPADGYIKITNDPADFIVYVVNSVHILYSIYSLTEDIAGFDIYSDTFAKEITMRLIAEKAYIELIENGDTTFIKELLSKMSELSLFSSNSVSDFTGTIANNMTELKLEEIIVEAGISAGIEIAESVFEYFLGPIGTTLNVLFSMGKADNIMVHCANFANSFDSAVSIFIQNNYTDNYRISRGVSINSETPLSDDVSLNVFELVLDESVLSLIEDSNSEVYSAIDTGIEQTYNISLLNSNEEEMQPEGKVTVNIPIPSDLEILAYLKGVKIFRLEEDGRTTEMDVSIENGCFVFETDHFSIYTIVGASSFIPLKMFVISCAIFIIFIISVSKIITILRKKRRIRSSGTVS